MTFFQSQRKVLTRLKVPRGKAEKLQLTGNGYESNKDKKGEATHILERNQETPSVQGLEFHEQQIGRMNRCNG